MRIHFSMDCLKRSDNEHRQPANILWGAFAVFTFAILLFVSYAAIDHHWERQNLEAQIDEVNDQMRKLASYSAHAGDADEKIRPVVAEQINEKRKCDRNFAVINQVQKQMDAVDQEYLKMWDEMPKPFLHLVGSSTHCKEDTGNVDDMLTVSGWKVDGGGNCFDTDLSTDDKDNVIIPVYGNYSVYTHITFKCPSKTGNLPTIHRHVVQFIETSGDYHDDPKILMENAYQLCGKDDAGKIKTSRQGGVYRFTEQDILRVLVEKDSKTELLSGEEAMFAVYLV